MLPMVVNAEGCTGDKLPLPVKSSHDGTVSTDRRVTPVKRRVTGALKPVASARKPRSAANLGEGNTDFKPPLPCGYTFYGKGFGS